MEKHIKFLKEYIEKIENNKDYKTTDSDLIVLYEILDYIIEY